MNTYAMVIGYVVLVISSLMVVPLAMWIAAEWSWKSVKRHAQYFDCLVIYMQKGRKAAKEWTQKTEAK